MCLMNIIASFRRTGPLDELSTTAPETASHLPEEYLDRELHFN